MSADGATRYLARLEGGPLDGLSFSQRAPRATISLPIPSASVATSSGVRPTSALLADYRLATPIGSVSDDRSDLVLLRYTHVARPRAQER